MVFLCWREVWQGEHYPSVKSESVVSEKNCPKDSKTGCRCVPVKERKAREQMAARLLKGLFSVVSSCTTWTVSIPFFTSEKQRGNEIWCSLHNARVFSLWATLEPQQDLGQHLLHACLHELHFESICRDHRKCTLKAAGVFEVMQTKKLSPCALASPFSGAVTVLILFGTDILALGWHEGTMSKASALTWDTPCIARHEFPFLSNLYLVSR